MGDLENREFLSLFLYGEADVRVEDDGGAGGLCVELPLLWDPRSLGAWSGTDGEGEQEMFYLRREWDWSGWQPRRKGFSAMRWHEMKAVKAALLLLTSTKPASVHTPTASYTLCWCFDWFRMQRWVRRANTAALHWTDLAANRKCGRGRERSTERTGTERKYR